MPVKTNTGSSSKHKNIIINEKLGYNYVGYGPLSYQVFTAGGEYALATTFTNPPSIAFTNIKASNAATIYCKEPVDLTGVIKITIEYTGSYQGGNLSIGSTTALSNRSVSWKGTENYGTAAGTVEMDVSDLTGKYYIGFKPANSPASNLWSYITKIELS